MKTKTILIGLAVFLVWCAIEAIYCENKGYKRGFADGTGNTQHDTTIVVDTVREYYPVEEYKYVDRLVYVPVTDTIHQHDTTYLVMQMEVKGYKDEDFALEIEGIQPFLRWIEVYPKTTYITNTVTKEVPYKYTFSAFAEASATLNYYNARAGLMYDRQISGRWRGYAAVGYEYGSLGKGPFAQVGTKFNILQK